jgi:hypothetical protein
VKHFEARIFGLVLTLALGLHAGRAVPGQKPLYLVQEVAPSNVFGFKGGWNLTEYMPGGPWLYTRGRPFLEISNSPTVNDVNACAGTNFPTASDRWMHGANGNYAGSYGRTVGLCTRGGNVDGQHYNSSGYVHFFGEDVRPWRDAGGLAVELNASVESVTLAPGDHAYQMIGLLLRDMSSFHYVWIGWQIYDDRPAVHPESTGIDATPDGGGYAYAATTFDPSTTLRYTSTLSGSAEFQHATWTGTKWFGASIDNNQLGDAVTDMRSQPGYADLSLETADYRLIAIYAFVEVYLSRPDNASSVGGMFDGFLVRTH